MRYKPVYIRIIVFLLIFAISSGQVMTGAVFAARVTPNQGSQWLDTNMFLKTDSGQTIRAADVGDIAEIWGFTPESLRSFIRGGGRLSAQDARWYLTTSSSMTTSTRASMEEYFDLEMGSADSLGESEYIYFDDHSRRSIVQMFVKEYGGSSHNSSRYDAIFTKDHALNLLKYSSMTGAVRGSLEDAFGIDHGDYEQNDGNGWKKTETGQETLIAADGTRKPSGSRDDTETPTHSSSERPDPTRPTVSYDDGSWEYEDEDDDDGDRDGDADGDDDGPRGPWDDPDLKDDDDDSPGGPDGSPGSDSDTDDEDGDDGDDEGTKPGGDSSPAIPENMGGQKKGTITVTADGAADLQYSTLGPIPWPNAPEEARKEINHLDGGVDLRVMGTGGYPGYTSNLMEIAAMQSIALEESTIVEYEEEKFQETTDDSIVSTIGGIFTGVIDAIVNVASSFADWVTHAIPPLEEYWEKRETEKIVKTMMTYSKPLFDQSHNIAMSVQMSILPTQRTLGNIDGTGNGFSTIYGEGVSDADMDTAKVQSEVDYDPSIAETAKEIWLDLKARGLDDVHCAGLLGNFFQESTWNPGCIEGNGNGHGLGQWSNSRRVSFLNYFSRTGTDWKTDISGQLDFLFYHDDESDLKIVQNYLNTSFSSVHDAVAYWCENWERCHAKDRHYERRVPGGIWAYNQFGSGQLGGSIDPNRPASEDGEEGSTTSSTEQAAEKMIIHTPNLDDEGNILTNEDGTPKYFNYDNGFTEDFVTEKLNFDGADYLSIEIYAGTSSKYRAWAAVYKGDIYPTPGNYSRSVRGKMGEGGGSDKGSVAHENNIVISGDSCYLYYKRSTSSGSSDYGLYAVITPHMAPGKKIIRTPIEEVKYAHTPNINDDGTANGTYPEKELKSWFMTPVTIDGAAYLDVDIWYATYKYDDYARDHVQVYQGIYHEDGAKKLHTDYLCGGGNDEDPTAKPDEEHHRTFRVEGDTVSFVWKYMTKNVSHPNYYGYYATIKGTSKEEITEVDYEAPKSGFVQDSDSLGMVYDVNMCPDKEHKGYGCMTYDGFSYNDIERKTVYYLDEPVDNVQPAATVFPNKYWACNAPDATESQFYEALDHNQLTETDGCWVIEADGSGEEDGDDYPEARGSTFIDSHYANDYGYEAIKKDPHEMIIRVCTGLDIDEDEDGEEEIVGWYYDDYKFTHKCKGNHFGYYCGGHLRIVMYGLVMHMTKAEREGDVTQYSDKNEKIGPYKVVDTSGELSLDKNIILDAEDLFEIDHGIVHLRGSVSDDFAGWTMENIENAVTKLEEDWYDMYGIQASWTIAGINGASAVMSTTDKIMVEKLTNAQTELGDNATKNIRLQAIEKALKYVGEIGYNKNHHASELHFGGLSDNSGYISQVWSTAFGNKIYHASDMISLAEENGCYHAMSEGGIKPGDIIVSTVSDEEGNLEERVMIYTGKENDEMMVVECVAAGTLYRNKGEAFYSEAHYIDMDVFAQAYLNEHPEADVLPDSMKTSAVKATLYGTTHTEALKLIEKVRALAISSERKSAVITALSTVEDSSFSYTWGGGHSGEYRDSTARHLDCSGFVSWLYYAQGIDLGAPATDGLRDMAISEGYPSGGIPLSTAASQNKVYVGDIVVSRESGSGHTGIVVWVENGTAYVVDSYTKGKPPRLLNGNNYSGHGGFKWIIHSKIP